LGRIFYLQIIKGDLYLKKAEDNRQRSIPIVSERGLIYDRNGIQITKNIPNFSIALMPQYLPKSSAERKAVIERLAKITKESSDEIEIVFRRYGSYSYESIVIKEGIDYDTALKILIENSDLPGIHIKRGSKRLYINEFFEKDGTVSIVNSMSHIIGYEGKLDERELKDLRNQGYLPSDYIGKTGIEKNYEALLRGGYGSQLIEVDAYGKERNLISETAPTPGGHIVLTIDLEMQNELEKILNSSLKEIEKTKAAAIGFDNNDFSGGIEYEKYLGYVQNPDNPLFNRAISGTYPSGSTIKPAISAAALQESLINASTSFLSTGGIQVGHWFFPDWQFGGHGITNVRKSLAWSVNTFYYYIGGGYEDFIGLGVKKIEQYLAMFGFGKKSGIDLPGEVAGFIPTRDWKEETKKENWYVGDTYNLSIGQGDLLVTPLQIANMTASIANSGILYEPHLTKQFIDPISGLIEDAQPKILNQYFIDKEKMNIVRLGMKDCVDYGTCQVLRNLPINIAGKTGTAQWSNTKDTHAWFTSFAPFYNPEIVFTLILEEGGEGGINAIPIAYKFYEWWLTSHK